MAIKVVTTATNAKTLNKSLLEAFNSINDGTLKTAKAKDLANMAGKAIVLNLGRLENKRLTKHDKEIDFWVE